MSDHVADRLVALERLLSLHAEETRTRLDILTEKILTAISRWDDKLDDVRDQVRHLDRRVTALETKKRRSPAQKRK